MMFSNNLRCGAARSGLGEHRMAPRHNDMRAGSVPVALDLLAELRLRMR